MKNRLTIIADSITNSVFEGQVATPLIERIQHGDLTSATIISYEQEKPSTAAQWQASSLLAEHGISLVIRHRKRFLTSNSLRSAVQHCAQFIRKNNIDHIVARGPLAGHIALEAQKQVSSSAELTIQARGLLAEEFRYTHQQTANTLRRILYALRFRQLLSFERQIYSNPSAKIEAVSYAMATYLSNEFSVALDTISIAEEDKVPVFEPALVSSWRDLSRTEFGINPTATVYCYVGSAKPWQCPQETVDYFIDKLTENRTAHLLIITQDLDYFEELLSSLPPENYTLCTVPHADIYQYLAAADYGLLFRKPDPVNWVSRPTKALEYKAVGLSIIHNNTVAWLE